MCVLKIEMRDGFSGDSARVCVDGTLALEFDDLGTDYAIGLAAQGEVDVSAGPHRIRVAVPSRNLSGELDVVVAGTLYVCVSVDAGRIGFRTDDTPFPLF